MKKKYFLLSSFFIVLMIIVAGCNVAQIASVVGIALPAGYTADELQFTGSLNKSGTTIGGSIACFTPGSATPVYITKGNFLTTKIGNGSSPTCTVTVNFTAGSSSTRANPYDAMVVIDNTGSMDSNDPLKDIIPAAQNFVTAALSGSTAITGTLIGLNHFGEGGTFDGNAIEVALTNVVATLNANIASANHTGSSTDLYDAISYSVDDLVAHKVNTKQFVLALTDGNDNSSTATQASVISKANAANLQINTLGLGSGVNTTALEAIATGTGGFYQALTTANINTFYTNFATVTSTAGTLSIDLSGSCITLVAGQTYTIEIVFVFTDASGSTTTTTETFSYTHS